MPDLDEAARVSRRAVLKGAAGAGAAGLAASAIAGVALPAAAAPARTITTSTNSGPADGSAAAEAIVAHVRDAASGEIDVFRGTTQIRLYDRGLAARLAETLRGN